MIAVAETGQAVPHLLKHLRIVLAAARGLANPYRREWVCACQGRSKFCDSRPTVLGLSAQQIRFCAKPSVPFDTTGQCMSKRLDFAMPERWVEHDSLHVAVNHHATMNMGLNVMVKRVAMSNRSSQTFDKGKTVGHAEMTRLVDAVWMAKRRSRQHAGCKP